MTDTWSLINFCGVGDTWEATVREAGPGAGGTRPVN